MAIALVITLINHPVAAAKVDDDFGEMTVTGTRIDDPLRGTRGLKLPERPLPAGDGAEALKDIAGFSLIRQGGAASDPLLRGLGGSRLNILIDGNSFAGACNHRMDPATSYVHPGAFDVLTLLKGPQSVRYGAAVSGVVSFEREPPRFDVARAELDVNAMRGSFDRRELAVDAVAGAAPGYLRFSGSDSAGDNYTDGRGEEVFSLYDRWDLNLALGITPDPTSRLELSAARSDAEMANATIHMDGVKFDRQSYGIKAEKTDISPWLKKVEAHANYHYVDHLMDDFSLRDRSLPASLPSRIELVRTVSTIDEFTAALGEMSALLGGAGFSQNFDAMNQDWEETQAGGSFTLAAGERVEVLLGSDYRKTEYTARALSGSEIYFPETDIDISGCLLFIAPFGCLAPVAVVVNNPLVHLNDRPDVGTVPRNTIVNFESLGVYTEIAWQVTAGSRLIGGVRRDWRVTDTGAMHLNAELSPGLAPGANSHRFQGAWSGFLRDEYTFAELPLTVAIGAGHAERPADYWEVYSFGGMFLDREKNTEIDAALVWGGERVSATLSAFLSRMTDFILTRDDSTAANIDAARWGGELDLKVRLFGGLIANGAVAGVHAHNDTQNVPLAQTPPPEARLGLRYERGPLSVGATGRFVADQNRVHEGYGNTLATDFGPTPGFAVYSVDAVFAPNRHARVSLGIDNLTDRDYFEHISRVNTTATGFLPTERVFEPGIAVWARLNLNLD